MGKDLPTFKILIDDTDETGIKDIKFCSDPLPGFEFVVVNKNTYITPKDGHYSVDGVKRFLTKGEILQDVKQVLLLPC